MIKKILFFPGFLIIAIIYFFPTERGFGRNTIMGFRWWEYRDKLAPVFSIALYLLLAAFAFPHHSSESKVTNTAKSSPSVEKITKQEQPVQVHDSANTTSGSESAFITEQPEIFDTLCVAKEKIVFSCSTGKKVISVCSSENLSSDTGYVQYRYGTKTMTELTFPEQKNHPKDFATGGNLTFSGGGGSYMRLNNSAYSYIVYSGIGKNWEKDGLVVEKGGETLSNILCKSSVVSNIGVDFYEKNAVPEDTVGFEIP